MRAARTLALALLLALVAAPALAQDEAEDEGEVDYSQEGLYLGIRGLYAVEDWSSENSTGADDTDGTGFTLGYRMSPFVALEIDIEWIRDFISADKRNVTLINTSTRMKVYPLQGRYQPYVMGGIGILATSVTNRQGTKPRSDRSDWAFRGGAGMDFYLTENLSLNAEASYVAPVGNVEDLNYAAFGLGVTYRFNSLDD